MPPPSAARHAVPYLGSGRDTRGRQGDGSRAAGGGGTAAGLRAGRRQPLPGTPAEPLLRRQLPAHRRRGSGPRPARTSAQRRRGSPARPGLGRRLRPALLSAGRAGLRGGQLRRGGAGHLPAGDRSGAQHRSRPASQPPALCGPQLRCGGELRRAGACAGPRCLTGRDPQGAASGRAAADLQPAAALGLHRADRPHLPPRLCARAALRRPGYAGTAVGPRLLGREAAPQQYAAAQLPRPPRAAAPGDHRPRRGACSRQTWRWRGCRCCATSRGSWKSAPAATRSRRMQYTEHP